MPYLSKNDIEAIAKRVIAAYRRLPELQGRGNDRVSPKLLVDKLLGLSTRYHTLSRSGTILGLTSCGEIGVPIFDNPEHPEHFFLDGNTVLIDKSLIAENANRGRYHFTLAHEACHQIFKMLYPREYINAVAQRKIHYCTQPPITANDYWDEWRTNTLASAILMPADAVQINMLAFGLGEKLRLLNKVFAPDDYKRFCKMADHMGVSKTALSIRLRQLGLLEISHLKNPYELVEVFPDEEDYDV